MSAVKRLKKELEMIKKQPPEFIDAMPASQSSFLKWYFIITGPPATPYEGGQYIGQINFPSEYPFAPPSFMIMTPNGRFIPGMRICLSMSDYHPETWNPAWSVTTMLVGLLSFMLSAEYAHGVVKPPPTEAEVRALASASRAFNAKNYRKLLQNIFPTHFN